MSSGTRKALYIAIVCALLMALPAALAAVLLAELAPPERQAVLAFLESRMGVVLMLTVVALVAAGGLTAAAYAATLGQAHRMGEQLRVIATVNPQLRLAANGGAELRELAAEVNALAEERSALQADVDHQVAVAKASVEAERNRLGALMSELGQSVVVCNLGGNVLLYNREARTQLEAGAGGSGDAGQARLGLGRSIFAFVERELIAHALEQIRRRLEKGEKRPVAKLVTSLSGGPLLRVQVAPVLGMTAQDAADGIDGYVLMMEDVTRGSETEGQRDRVINTLTEGSRASLGAVGAAVETLLEYPDIQADQREHFLHIIRDEVAQLGRRINVAHQELGNAMRTRWPLEDMLAGDLVLAAAKRIEARCGLPTKTEEMAEEAWVKVDSFTLLQAFHYLAQRLAEEFEVRELRFATREVGRLVELDLIWSGVVMGSETLTLWETEPMSQAGDFPPLTLREVVERHDGEMWFQRNKATHRTCFRLVLSAAAPAGHAAEHTREVESRPAYYDFDLFAKREVSGELEACSLEELAYTAFDTETTGLEPGAGDEIIQVGAVRIVNGKLLRGEVFDQLIDPRRPLKPESVAVHGITPEMLRGQPEIAKVLPAFHAFCADTVLVAHNAAFDMRFLQLKEAASGVRFTQPVLDTLLLSAVVHPGQEAHRLEAIAERLGVSVVGRHTALGDALVTGEVLIRLLPLLKAQGILTLAQALEASAKTPYARVKY